MAWFFVWRPESGLLFKPACRTPFPGLGLTGRVEKGLPADAKVSAGFLFLRHLEAPMKDMTGVEVSKVVDWSYPSSPNATRFGFSRTGCWTVSRHFAHETRSILPEHLSGHATRPEALAAAGQMPEPWSPMFVRLHPADAAPVLDPCAGA
jgi:hypothetical protein